MQDIVRACAGLRVPVVPQGVNTSYCAAATPSRDGNEIIVSLERMNRLRKLERAASNADLLLRLAL